MFESLILEFHFNGTIGRYESQEGDITILARDLQSGLSLLGQTAWYVVGMTGTTRVGQPIFIFLEREI